MKPRRWAGWLAALAAGLAVLAGLTANEGRWLAWGPVLGVAFAAVCVAEIADAYRTGVVSWKFRDADRFEEPTAFYTAIGLYGILALFCTFIAFGVAIDYVRGLFR